MPAVENGFVWIEWIHRAVIVVLAVGFFGYWSRTRFWFPNYVHVLASVALALGIAIISDPNPPREQVEWSSLHKTGVALLFPALVYVAHVFFGGQREAYERTFPLQTCVNCGTARVRAGQSCPHCGQTALRK